MQLYKLIPAYICLYHKSLITEYVFVHLTSAIYGMGIHDQSYPAPNHTLIRRQCHLILGGMKKKLTPKSIDALPPATGKRYEVHDQLLPGLHLRVSATGGKVFGVSRRINGRMKRIRIGAYPVVSLADAREKARDILRDIELGQYASPFVVDRARRLTLGEVVPQFIKLYSKPRNRDWRGTERVLQKFSPLFNRPIDQIKRANIVRVLDTIIAGGAPTRANRALAAIKKLMNWCVDRAMIETSPVASLRPPTKEVARDRVLADQEVLSIYGAGSTEGFPFEQFLKLLFLTGQRRSEVAGMRWSELDLGEGIWTLPAKRTKNASLHTIPLTPLAIFILKSVPRFLDSDLVFTTTGTSPISGFGRLKERLDVAIGLDAED